MDVSIVHQNPTPHNGQMSPIQAAEFRIFYCENRKAKSTHRRNYWQKQLNNAWVNLANLLKQAGDK